MDGGAISNYGNIGNIVGDFSANYLVFNNSSRQYANYYTTYSKVYGGAIANTGTIENISGDFTGNYVFADYGEGGAIHNKGTIKSITNSNFTNNYVLSDDDYDAPKGGAIYTNSSLNIVADNGTSKFSGNYVPSGSGSYGSNSYVSGTKLYEAIYVDSSSATLKLEAKNGGTIQFDDYINGSSGYNINVTGDSTGTVKMYNDMKNADVSVDTVTFDTANTNIHNYVVKTLTSNENANYSIDVCLDEQSADMFTTSSASSGTVTLDSLNLINSYGSGSYGSGSYGSGSYSNLKIQVLNTQNDNLQLALSDNVQKIYIDTGSSSIVSDEVTPNVNWDDKFNIYKQGVMNVGTVVLATTKTTNDSISFSFEEEYTKLLLGQGDTLKLLNQLSTT